MDGTLISKYSEVDLRSEPIFFLFVCVPERAFIFLI